jgi:hypothetical protein
MVADPISPELVLVSPELRERALSTLPAVDADAPIAVAPRPARAAEPVASFPVALAAYVAEAVVLGALRGTAMIAVVAAAAFLLAR